MTDENKQTKQEFAYKAEMKQLLHLIVHSLYTHPEVFLRELISNASDALNKVRFMQVTNKSVLEPDAELGIGIEIDKDAHSFSIEDSGLGMTREDLIDRIGTVASSGTIDFFERMKNDKGSIEGSDLIGQFGVGFYSVFMVTDEVTIETRHADPGSKGYRWISTGEGTYTIEEIEREHRGTKISFKLKEEHQDLAEDYRLRSIIKKYSNFVDFPISIDKEKVNTVSALWHKSKDEITDEELKDFYKFVSMDFQDPMDHLQLNLEGRVNFKALLFVPAKAPTRYFDPNEEKSLQLYSNRVFIQDDCEDLTPDYLRFLRGVVDTEDLPLNVSREVTQSSPVMTKIREVITSRMLGMLEEWATTDPEKYSKFFEQFGPYIKLGTTTDFTNKEKLVELLRFETTKTEAGKFTSLKEYVSAMSEEQKEIYYITGESRTAVEKNPNLEYFRKNDIEVLFFTHPVDVFTVTNLPEYDGKNLVSTEKADISLEKDDRKEQESLEQKETESLLKRFKQILGDRVEDVVESKRLVNSAATLVIGKEGMDAQMERMMKMMDQNYSSGKKILELNTAHPLIRNLSRIYEADAKSALLERSVTQLYEGAMLIEDNLENPAEFVRRMTDFMESATKE